MCTKIMVETKKAPACLSNRCHIQDIMQSEESAQLSAMVEAFVHVEMLQDSRGYDQMLNRITKENNLNSISPFALVKLKSLLQRHRQAASGSKDG